MLDGLVSPHELYSYNYHKFHSEIGVMCTNWTLSNGGLTLIGFDDLELR